MQYLPATIVCEIAYCHDGKCAPMLVSRHPKNLIDKPVREPDGWRATEKLYRLAAFVGRQVGRQQKNQHIKRLFFGATFCCWRDYGIVQINLNSIHCVLITK